MITTKAHAVLPEDSTTPEVLAAYLNYQETRDREIVDFNLGEAPSGKFNVLEYRLNGAVRDLPRIQVFPIAQANAQKELREHLRGNTAIAYTPALIDGKEQDVLITRAGGTIQLRGKMSTFGGKNDTGMTPTEGLALIQQAHFEKFKDYFVTGTTSPLGRALNPDKYYIACRWDRNLTPYSWLRDNQVTVRNPLTGKILKAQPMDWGPAAWTGRIADLSPGLARDLELDTDDMCEVTIPLKFAPVTSGKFIEARNASHEKLVAIATKQHNLFSGCDEGDQPLRGQIEKYWTELGLAFPGVETPWSAAFVSWGLKQAGATKQQVNFSGRHTDYIYPMIQNAKAGTGAFRALPFENEPLRFGDLLHNYRGKRKTFTYADAEELKDYDSHTAIVVGFGEGANGKYALTIGGNEGDSVRRKEVPLNDDGTVKPRKKEPYVAVVKTFLT